jgi:hypothetical protein
MHSVQLQYNSANNILKLDFPETWNTNELGDQTVKIQIEDNSGTELLAAASVTLTTTLNTISGATSIGDNSVTLTNAPASAFSVGDRFVVAKSATGPYETVEMLYYNSSTKVMTLTKPMNYAHSASSGIHALTARYTLDTTTVATWTLGLECTINWIPLGKEQLRLSQRGEVVNFTFDLQGLESTFAKLYPQEYRMIETEFSTFATEAINRTKRNILSIGKDADRLRDPQILLSPIMEYICYLANKSSATDSRLTEMGSALTEYNRLMNEIKESPVWFDDDQDDVLDEQEEGPIYAPPGRRGY